MQTPDRVSVYRYWTLEGCWDPGFNPWPFLKKEDAEAFVKLIELALKHHADTDDDWVTYEGKAWSGLTTLVLDPDDLTHVPAKLEVVPWYVEEPFEEASTLCSVRDALEIYAE